MSRCIVGRWRRGPLRRAAGTEWTAVVQVPPRRFSPEMKDDTARPRPAPHLPRFTFHVSRFTHHGSPVTQTPARFLLPFLPALYRAGRGHRFRPVPHLEQRTRCSQQYNHVHPAPGLPPPFPGQLLFVVVVVLVLVLVLLTLPMLRTPPIRSCSELFGVQNVIRNQSRPSPTKN
jgi:hypothetical protein